jgi:ribosomal protein S18 acetylase RimI-like enzyme
METNPNANGVIIAKFDHELSNTEVHQIFSVYNECFYDNKVTKTKDINLAKSWISKHKLFRWYYIKLDNRIISIGNYVYNYGNIDGFVIRPDRGENITSIGTLEKYRGKGYAKRIIEAIANDYNDLIDLTLELKKNNPKKNFLIKCYQSMGFSEMDDTEPDNIYMTKPKIKQ